jgi:lipoprotein-releasing system permease protein
MPWSSALVRPSPTTKRSQPLSRPLPGVEATTPYIYGQALISSATHSTGVVLRGIDAASAMRVISIGRKMIAGQLTDLDKPFEVPAIIVGRDMARQLQVGVGDRIRLISPNGPLSPMGILPKIRTCVVAGIFETGMFEYDSTIGYINLDTARSLTDLRQGVHGIEVRVRDIDQADRTAVAIQQALGQGYSVRDWMQLNQNLFAALKLEKIGIFIALNLIILVAALNIISALIMVVMEKNRDIAILKSMGATTRSIMRIFFYQGMVIGISGHGAGRGQRPGPLRPAGALQDHRAAKKRLSDVHHADQGGAAGSGRDCRFRPAHHPGRHPLPLVEGLAHPAGGGAEL